MQIMLALVILSLGLGQDVLLSLFLESLRLLLAVRALGWALLVTSPSQLMGSRRTHVAEGNLAQHCFVHIGLVRCSAKRMTLESAGMLTFKHHTTE